MRRFLHLLLRRLARLVGAPPGGGRGSGLTEVEYEAVSLIAYEGRDAFVRAREQAAYCRRRGSEPGYAFWTQVALEVARRTRGRIPENR